MPVSETSPTAVANKHHAQTVGAGNSVMKDDYFDGKLTFRDLQYFTLSEGEDGVVLLEGQCYQYEQ